MHGQYRRPKLPSLGGKEGMKFDLYKMALNAGMTQEEFIIELGREYATYLSLVLDQNPGCAFEYRVHFADHDVFDWSTKNRDR